MRDFLTPEFFASETEPLRKIADEASRAVVGIIAQRVKAIGKMDAEELKKLAAGYKVSDMKRINKIMADAAQRSMAEIETMFIRVAEKNDTLEEPFYKAKHKTAQTWLDDAERRDTVKASIANAKAEYLHLSNTLAFDINGMNDLKTAYNIAIDRAIYESSQGMVDFNTAMRDTIKALSDSGIQTIPFPSGNHQTLYSAVARNMRDGISRMSVEQRKSHGKEFGADGVEIGAHMPCAKDHASYQGKQYSLKDFERLQTALKRPFFTNNCTHTYNPVILAINEPNYSPGELKKMENDSAKEVFFNGVSGKPMKCSLYEATQYQRAVEASIRKSERLKEAYMTAGDSIGAKKVEMAILLKKKEYIRVSREIKMKPQLNNLKI